MSKNIDDAMARIETRLMALPHGGSSSGDACFYCRWLSTAHVFHAWVCGYSYVRLESAYREFKKLQKIAEIELKELLAARISKLELMLEDEDMKLENPHFSGFVRWKTVAEIEYDFVRPRLSYTRMFPPDKLDRDSWESWGETLQERLTRIPQLRDFWSGVVGVLADEGVDCQSFLVAARNSNMGNPLAMGGCNGFGASDFLAVVRTALEAQQQ